MRRRDQATGPGVRLALLQFLVLTSALRGAEVRTWDFEPEAVGLAIEAPAMAVAAEPGAAGNRVLRIAATQPHHTKLAVPGSEALTDFQLSLRFRFVETTGPAPRLYLYGRESQGGFRGVSLGPDGSGTVIHYRGQNARSDTFGDLSAPGVPASGWLRAAFACVGPHVFAKVWADGRPEPPWQVVAEGEAGGGGRAAVGVWLSPRAPATATALIDDVRFAPVGQAEAVAWLKPHEPRPPLVLADLPSQPGVFRRDGLVGIATRTMALALAETDGTVAHLVDRRSGREFVAARARRPLFQLRLTRPRVGQSLTLSAADFARCTVTEQDGGRLALEFSQAAEPGVVVRASVRPADGDGLGLGIAVAGAGTWCVADVAYPQVPLSGALGGDAADDRLLVPWQGGGLIDAPGLLRTDRSMAYPGGCPVPFYALYDEAAGLYIAPHDPDGHCKLLHLACRPESVNLDVVHRFPEEPAPEVRLPYDLVLRTFHGDWRTAADIYREWSTRSLWRCPPLSRRTDVPGFLTDGHVLVIDSFTGAEAAYARFGTDGEALLARLDAYRERTGAKGLIFVPYGWEGRGTWAGIHYLPAQPSNDYWQRVNARLAEHGHGSAALLSGYWWVVKRQKTGSGPAFDDSADFARRQDLCVRTATGAVWQVDNYAETGQFGDWRGLSVGLCHGSAAAADTLYAQFVGTARLGFPLLSFDQEIGGSQHAPCYAADHGHPPGYGEWMWRGFRDLCTRLRQDGVALFMENESDLAVPYLATYWSRQFGEVDIGGLPGARGVGLFSYLYHDYVTAIGAACVQGQGAQGTNPDVLLRCRVFANNLTRGLIPGPFLSLVPLEPGADEYRRTCRDAFLSFCRPYSRFPEYLLLGQTVRPLAVECEEVESGYGTRKLSAAENADPTTRAAARRPLRLAAVTTGAFRAEDGSVAHVVVNGTPTARRATVVLPPGPAAVVYSAERGELAQLPTATEPRRLPLDLEPFGVRVLVCR